MNDDLSVDTFEIESEFRSEWEAEFKRLTDLSKKVTNLHVKCLYCETPPINKLANEALTAIVKKVSGSSGHWRELGMFFELHHDDLDYIEHAVTADKTDTVLQVFMLKHDNATIDKVTDALCKMKRYDVLKEVEEPLLQICQYFFNGNTNNSDTGYNSIGSSSKYTIITPKTIRITLPEFLKNFNYDDNSLHSDDRDKPPIHQSRGRPVPALDKNKPMLLLTFAADGKDIADAIPIWTSSWADESLDVQVVTLNERRNEVQQNPEIVIRELIQEADYIVPILTEGYIECITSKNPANRSSTTNLDVQYTHYIYNQLLHKYAVDSCFNKNVRSILPKSVDHRLFGMYPELIPWTCEVDFDTTFKDLIERVKKTADWNG